MAEGDVSDLFSDVSDISYTSELDDAPVSVKYDLSNGSPLERDKFKVVHFNINSITAESKLTTLIDLCKTLNIHVLILTESKLDLTIPDNNIEIPGYHHPIRHDRTENGRHGGGCLMYILNTITYKHNINKQSDKFQHIWVDIKVKNKTIAVNTFYRPPNETAEDHEVFLEFSEALLSDLSEHEADIKVIASDMNFGNCYCLNPNLDFKPLDNSAPELFSSFNFQQLIDIPTRVCSTSVSTTISLIDLLFVDSQDLVEEFGLLPSIADHAGLLLCLNLKLKPRKNTKKTILDYSNVDKESLCTFVKDFNFEQELFSLPVQKQAEKFTNILKDCLDKFVTKKDVFIKPDGIPWCNTYTRLLLRKKNRNYLLFKKSAESLANARNDGGVSPETITKLLNRREKTSKNFKTASKESLKANRRAKQAFFNSVNSTMQNFQISARKKFRILTKLMNNTKYSSIASLIEDGKVIEDSQQKSDILNKYFTNKAKVDGDEDEIPLLDKKENIESLNNVNTSPIEIAKLMRSIKESQFSHCGIPGKFISMIATPLSFPFSRMLNNMFDIGYFPEIWKVSHVTPIYKYKGQKTDKANYRPISLLPTLSKLCESIVHKRLLDHCMKNNIITDKQAAYLKGDSTVQQLLYIVDSIKKQWTKGFLTHGIFLDVKAAFDKVWHRGLIAKLEQICVGGDLLQLFTSYLSDRQQIVVVDGCKSNVRSVAAGVPQGSRLGPLLFIIYINDIIEDIESDILIFADDTSLLAKGKTIDETAEILKRDLQKVVDWAAKWKVTFAADKTKQMIFSKKNITNSPLLLLNNEEIKRVKHHKHLGLFMSENLDWSAHVHYVCMRANRKLAVLRKNRMLSRHTLDILYKITVRSIIDYALPVYFHSLKVTEKAKLDKIQYAAAKVVTGVRHQASRTRLNQELAWEEISTRATFLGLTLFQKIADHETRPLIRACMPKRSVQKRLDTFTHFSFKGMDYSNSYFPFFTKTYNNIKKEVRDLNLADFKKNLAEDMKPSKRKHYNVGHKYANTLLTSIRVGHSKLNSDTYKLGMSETNLCPNCLKPETALHFITQCPQYAEQRQTVLDQIEQHFMPRFKNLSFKRQFEILVVGFEPDNPEMKKINSKIQKITQSFILQTKRFIEK